MNCLPYNLKDSQAVGQRDGSILKHAGMFEHAKRKSKKGNKPFFNFVEKLSFFLSL